MIALTAVRGLSLGEGVFSPDMDSLRRHLCIEDIDDGVRYRLPRRRVFHDDDVVWTVLRGVFFVPLMLLHSVTIIHGRGSLWLQFYLGRETIELCGGALRRTMRVGPFRWTELIDTACVSTLRVDGPLFPSTGAPDTGYLPAEYVDLIAVADGARRSMLLYCYPVQWVEPIAGDLAARLRRAGRSVSVARRKADERSDSNAALPPSIGCERTTGGLVLEAPGSGMTRQVGRALGMAGIFLLCACGIIIAALAAGPAGWFNLPFLFREAVIFMCASVLYFCVFDPALKTCRSAFAPTRFAVSDGRLHIRQAGRMSFRRHEWDAAVIYDIREQSSIEQNFAASRDEGQSVHELAILLYDGTTRRYLAGHDPLHIQAVASALRSAIGLGDRGDGEHALP